MLYDISRPIEPASAVFPGDTPFRADWTLRLEKGHSVNLSTITMSPHVGTHADSFYHYDPHGAPIDEIPLEQFLGPCRVIEVEGDVTLDALRGLDLAREERLLFRTARRVDYRLWEDDYPTLAPAAAAAMAKAGLKLVGIDQPSVDKSDSKTLPAHHALGRGKVVNLENLDLTGVPEGRYELLALPLKMKGLDGSPVRAVLRTL
ncbi:MAG TPA: arylformamidase [Candidatus Thermoplasmatota archaeon]|nr:arylformamidase [Candidatus Thermoplasmatota archaeon]